MTKGFGFFTMVLALWSMSAGAEIVTEEVKYKSDDTVMVGYLAYDDSITRQRPGVLVIHEWWGHNEYARTRARMLAELGYTALALDMYGEGKTADHPKAAGEFAGAIRKNMAVAQKRFQAAYQLLANHKTTGKAISAIGYCFGGGVALEMARAGADLRAVVSFHGSLGTSNPAKAGTVKARILVANGAADPFVKPEEIKAFKSEMAAAGVKMTFLSYPGAKHAFTNKAADKYGKKFNIPLAYNQSADEQSWRAMKTFLAEASK